MTERRTKRIQLLEREVWGSLISEDHPDADRVVDVIAWLESLLNQAPEEFRSELRLEVSSTSSYDVPVTEMEIYYDRPETDQEVVQRRLDAERSARLKREQELRTLRELQAKYGHLK